MPMIPTKNPTARDPERPCLITDHCSKAIPWQCAIPAPNHNHAPNPPMQPYIHTKEPELHLSLGVVISPRSTTRSVVIVGKPHHDALIADIDELLELLDDLLLVQEFLLKLFNLLFGLFPQLIALLFHIGNFLAEVCADTIFRRRVRFAVYGWSVLGKLGRYL
ncbi:hypothetical protein B0T19DRAFT_234281 [Cercophora scortea]|uniref:Uncharacterized protein n=1 Tax=Cercophora scortea TaxID=314031 RepID=A0AAE0IGC1_9PEZI|nr:hypothetical protein B0T19DRAFT_234281 [Cercophora scortea]